MNALRETHNSALSTDPRPTELKIKKLLHAPEVEKEYFHAAAKVAEWDNLSENIK